MLLNGYKIYFSFILIILYRIRLILRREYVSLKFIIHFKDNAGILCQLIIL